MVERRERASPIFAGITEIDETSPEVRALYINFLNDPRNRLHFARPPKTLEELNQDASSPGNTFLFGIAVENGKARVIGGLCIEDAAANQHDHFLTLMVVDPDLQGRGLGGRFLTQAINWVATRKTADGRVRNKLEAAIIRRVPEWERMERLLEGLGFDFRMRLPRQVDVPTITKDGKVDEEHMQTMPVERWELDIERWRKEHRLQPPPPEAASSY